MDSATIADRLPTRFCWCTRVPSPVTNTSMPFSTAACNSSPFLSSPYPIWAEMKISCVQRDQSLVLNLCGRFCYNRAFRRHVARAATEQSKLTAESQSTGDPGNSRVFLLTCYQVRRLKQLCPQECGCRARRGVPIPSRLFWSGPLVSSSEHEKAFLRASYKADARTEFFQCL